MAHDDAPTAAPQPHAGAHDTAAMHRHTHVHIVPLRVLLGVIVALMVLTWLTVAATWIDLGAANVWVALVIALVKATLVALYFMHLRYDNPFNGIVLICALAFVVLFIGVTLRDTLEYNPTLTKTPLTTTQQDRQAADDAAAPAP